MDLLVRHPDKCPPHGEDGSTLIYIMAFSSCNQITFLHVSHMYRREGESNPGLPAVDREYYPLHHAPISAHFFDFLHETSF